MKSVIKDGSFGEAELLHHQQCSAMLEKLERLPEHFWYPSGRRLGPPSFSWLDGRAIPPELLDMITQSSPRAPTWIPRGFMVRRYLPGQSAEASCHPTEVAIVVQIPLRCSRDGIVVQGKHYLDVAGLGYIVHITGPVITVPPVADTRYELLYLFDETI